MKYNLVESDIEYLYEVFGVIWGKDDGIPRLNGAELTEEDLLELINS